MKRARLSPVRAVPLPIAGAFVVVVAGAFLIALGAAGASADPIALASSAAKHCAKGDRDAAARDVTQLLEILGDDHAASPIVAVNLAQIERARGNESAAAALEQRAKATEQKVGSKKLDSKLKRALRKLRACAAPAPAQTPTD